MANLVPMSAPWIAHAVPFRDLVPKRSKKNSPLIGPPIPARLGRTTSNPLSDSL